MIDIYIVEDDMFAEELTVQAYIRLKDGRYSFTDGKDRKLSVGEVKDKLRLSIMQTWEQNKRNIVYNQGGRFINGRFGYDNICAKAPIPVNDELYLLYLICGSMNEVADLLGVCRQTVSKRIKQYKEDNKCEKDF